MHVAANMYQLPCDLFESVLLWIKAFSARYAVNSDLVWISDKSYIFNNCMVIYLRVNVVHLVLSSRVSDFRELGKYL